MNRINYMDFHKFHFKSLIFVIIRVKNNFWPLMVRVVSDAGLQTQLSCGGIGVRFGVRFTHFPNFPSRAAKL